MSLEGSPLERPPQILNRRRWRLHQGLQHLELDWPFSQHSSVATTGGGKSLAQRKRTHIYNVFADASHLTVARPCRAPSTTPDKVLYILNQSAIFCSSESLSHFGDLDKSATTKGMEVKNQVHGLSTFARDCSFVDPSGDFHDRYEFIYPGGSTGGLSTSSLE